MTVEKSQWFHVEAYSRQKSKKARWSCSDVLAEAFRDEGATGHVKNPEKPLVLLGSREAVEKAIEAAGLTKDNLGRKRASTALLLMSGVISFPEPMEKLKKNDPEVIARLGEWKNLSMKMLEKEYGDQLVGAIFHGDEGFPHIHFYVVPKSGVIADVHRGKAAEAAFKATKPAAGDAGKKSKEVYLNAMRLWQDDYYAQVGQFVGFARKSEKPRDRLSRKEWNATKAANKLAAECLKRQMNKIAAGEQALELKQKKYTAAVAKAEKLEGQRLELERSHAEEKKILLSQIAALRAESGLVEQLGLNKADSERQVQLEADKTAKNTVKTPSRGFDFGL